MTYPRDFTYAAQKAETAAFAADTIAHLAADRRVVVQAGGCAGLWPLALAQSFARVYTFEPEAENFRCLQANVAAVPTISATQAALGERPRRVALTRPKAQAGLWCVDGAGDIPMVTLDDALGDVAVDAIVLDVEGFEVHALHGAKRLIAAHRPLLWFEYLHNRTAIDVVLAAYGYRAPQRGIGGDSFSIHSSRVM